MQKVSPSAYKYLAQETVLIVTLSYLFLFASTQNGLLVSRILAVTAVLLSMIAAASFWFLRGMRSPLELPAFVFLGALVLTSLTSIDPRRSLAETWLIAIPFLLFFVALGLVRKGWPGELILKCVLIVGAVIMALAWVEPVSWYLHWLQVSPGTWLPDISFRLGMPNFLGVVLNLFLAVALARLAVTHTTSGRVILSAYIFSALGLLFLSSSRGGWLGTGAGLAVLAWCLFSSNQAKMTQVWQRIRTAPRLWVGGLVGLAICLAVLGWLLVRQATHPSHVPVLDSRGYLWGPAWQAFLESPLLGKGQHTYVDQFLRYHSSPPEMLFIYSHSLYLDMLSGSGVVGFAAFVWFGILLGRALLKRFRSAAGLEKAGAAGALAGLAAFGVHGFFDSVHHTVPTCLWVLLIIAAAALGEKDPGAALESREKSSFSWGTVVLGLLVAGGTWFNLWMLVPLEQGILAANTDQWAQAAARMEVAVQRDPWLAEVDQQLGLADAALASRGDSAALDRAIQAFELTTAKDRYWNVNFANLGALYRQKGDLESAVRSLQKAVELAPSWGLYHLNLGEALELQGATDRAAGEYAQALDLQPDWAQSVFWQGSDLRKMVRGAWVAAHPEKPAQPLASLEEAAAAAPEDVNTAMDLAEGYLAAGRATDAHHTLELAGTGSFIYQSESLRYLKLEARTARAMEDISTAQKLEGQLKIDYQFQGSYGPGTFGGGSYGPFLYRRPAMAMELVPQLTLITDLGE